MIQENNSKFTPPHPLNTAVLFLVFNRLDTTKQVFEAIREAKPPRLYVAADGARENREGEAEKVQAVREYVMNNIDWDCEVKTLLRDKNLGCKMAVSGAIDWFFKNEEMGIILEDDCLPSQSFFWFCEELLERYKDDSRIGQISGFNKLSKVDTFSNSYDFLTGGSIWGWASWKRVVKNFNEFYEKDTSRIYDAIYQFTDDLVESRYIKNNLDFVANGGLSTWDYHWGAMLKANSQLSVTPKKNLIKNIGFGEEATHTFGTFENPPIYEISIEHIEHPEFIAPNKTLSKLQANQHVSFLKKVLKKLKSLV